MFDLFEKKLGIMLSPNDYEIITRLQETYTESEIKNALEIAYQNNAKKVQYVVKILYNQSKDNLPEWFNKGYKAEPLTEEDIEEVQNAIECLKDFHPKDFDKWAEEQRKVNGICKHTR